MTNPAVIGLDIAKNLFQVHGADSDGRCVLRRLRRADVVAFFARLLRAWSALKAAQADIIGPANSVTSAMTPG